MPQACRLLSLLVPLALCAPGRAAHGQEAVVLRGRVTEDATGAAVPGAVVRVYDAAWQQLGRAVTSRAGDFGFTLRGRGPFRLHASRLGFQGATSPPLWTEGHDFFELEMRLDRSVVLLAPLEVVSRARVHISPVLDDFRARQAAGIGDFFTREDIERLHPAFLSDLLATLPGVHMESSGFGSQRTIYFARSQGRCPAQIYVDGLLVTRTTPRGELVESSLDASVHPEEVEAVEVYKGLATVPAQFMTTGSDCGVIAIWTRRGL
ncbi:MAG TPA: TonB-dependent receptor [Longimicrobium sp.]|nr:TonB-dependent receptor [Longimicrobium sp.]